MAADLSSTSRSPRSAKKHERYKFRINKGSVEIRVVLSQGQPPRYFTGKTYEEAERKADEAIRLAARDVVIDRDSWGNRPLGDWLDYWLNTVQRTRLQPTTFAKYEHQLRLYIKPHPVAARSCWISGTTISKPGAIGLRRAPSLKTASRRAVRGPTMQARLSQSPLQDFEQLARLAGDLEPLTGLTRLDIFAASLDCATVRGQAALHRVQPVRHGRSPRRKSRFDENQRRGRVNCTAVAPDRTRAHGGLRS